MAKVVHATSLSPLPAATTSSAVMRSHFDRFFGPLMSLTFDDAYDDSYCRIRSDLARSGTPLDPNDPLIAATAVANDLALVAASSKELGGVAGLSIENWKIGT